MPDSSSISDILLNPVLIVSVLVWFFAECTKVVAGKILNRPVKIFASGGMPSAHAAIICSAATVIALDQGFASPLFGLTVIVAAIVLHDSYRVRWMAGETAERVNALSKKGPKISVHRGHRLSEVIVGGLFGIVLSAVLYGWLYG
jgi:acid phosphatase family membrane protein YuiD